MTYTNKDVTFIIPSRENLHFLKYAYDSIRRNIGKEPYILCADDYSVLDGSKFWMEEIKQKDERFDYIVNDGPERLGHVILFNSLVEQVKTKLFVLAHADMVWLKGSLNGLLKYMKPKRVVSATRCEPASLHPPERCKISLDWLPTDPKDLDEERLQRYVDTFTNHSETKGIFAPYLMETDEYLSIGGCDPLFRPTSREDDDLWNRLILNGCDFVQSWQSFVYHRSCAGSRWNPTLTTVGTNSTEWDNQQMKSLKNFIRKWKSIPMHDEWHYPISPKHQFKTTFHVKNSNIDLIYLLEPWCDFLKCYDIPSVRNNIIYDIINHLQETTQFNIDDKFYNIPEIPNILVEIDCRTFNDLDFNYIQNLSAIINETNELGEFQIGNLKITINDLTHYEKDLIVV